MRGLIAIALVLLLAPAAGWAKDSKPAVARTPNEPIVEFEMMTWPEVKAALAQGKTTALFYTGGTEQRGPQNVNGGHTLMGKAIVKSVAQKLGSAIAMPVLPYTPNNASAGLTGTIGLTPDILAAILERVSEQAIVTGFGNIILMGDHGGGQPSVYQDVAKKLNEKYAAQGIHVFYCDDVYQKAQKDFDEWLTSEGYPPSLHGGLPDTAEMLYLGGDEWVRKDLVPTALGDTPPPPGASASLRINNGIVGDARRANAELGKKLFDLRVDYAVKQIRGFVNTTQGAH